MKRTLHSPLSRLLRRVHAACDASYRTGIPVDEIVERLPRREMLAAAGAAVLAPRVARAAGGPKVVIVGAGLAGLCCARALWQRQGIAAELYEWNDRVGGRVQTLRGHFDGGISVELHGQLISSEHTRMRALAAGYGLSLWNTYSHLEGGRDTAWFGGRRYNQAELAKDWQRYAWALFREAVRLAPHATYRHASRQARMWDAMSVTDWVARYIEGGLDSPLGGLCLADVISEFGSPPDRQSALNLIYTLGYDTSRPSGLQPRDTPLVAGTDEKYAVAGGNDQIIDGLVGDLPRGAIRTGHRLLAVRQTPGRRFVCSFESGGVTRDVIADHVVLAVPPPPLRDVDLSRVELSALQRLAIAQATLGCNAKIFLQVAGRPWTRDGYSGTILTDQLFCGGWDAANAQAGGHGPGAQGVYCAFPGGRPGQSLARRYGLRYGDDAGPAPPAMIDDTLAQIEPITPGVTAAWQAGPGKSWVSDGNIDRHLRGAYSNFLVGQYTAFGGAQSLRAGNLHFAGEHTSLRYQGFMEGAVQSGERAAAEIE